MFCLNVFELLHFLQKQEQKKIPPDFDYNSIPGLSNELKTKLTRIAPATIGQMERIPGMTEKAIFAVLIMMKKQEAVHAFNKDKDNLFR